MADSISILISIEEAGAGVFISVNNGLKNLNASAKADQSNLSSLNGYVKEFDSGLQRVAGALAGIGLAKGLINRAASLGEAETGARGAPGIRRAGREGFRMGPGFWHQGPIQRRGPLRHDSDRASWSGAFGVSFLVEALRVVSEQSSKESGPAHG